MYSHSMSKRRDSRFWINFTSQEHKDFKALAERRHTKLAEIVRQLLHKELDNEKKEQAA